jgi:ribosomal protein S18 acetylase RimI-like enzyme
MANATLRTFQPADHAAALALWQRTEGMGLGSWDEAGPIGQFLERNPGLSVVAEADGRLVGAVLCGHDGRRGFLYHLAVDREFRGQGLGRKLAESCLDRLRALGLTRCHIVAYQTNADSRRFWQHLGFRERPELLICSRDLGAEP